MKQFLAVLSMVYLVGLGAANAATCIARGSPCTYTIGQGQDPCCPGLSCGGGMTDGPYVSGVCMSCDGCTDCNSTEWAAVRVGYERRTVATCNCNTCSKSVQYRCAAGYYGTSTNGSSGCTPCPSLDGVSATSSAGNKLIGNCYIPAEKLIEDNAGKYFFTTNCYY